MNSTVKQKRDSRLVFETKRLQVFVAAAEDTDHFYELWTDPHVMGNVGFPQGLPITREQIFEQLQGQAGRIFDTRLIVILRDANSAIGECKLGQPDQEGVAATDVKLLPKYWGSKFGVEIKLALLEYLFTHTSCTSVEATPNVENIASIRMQEAVGGVRVGEAVFPVPESMQDHMIPVNYYIYRVFREKWISAQA